MEVHLCEKRQVRREHGDGGKGVRSDDSPGIISCPVQLRPPTLQSSLRVRCRHLLRHGPNPLRCAGRHCASPQAPTPSSPSSGTAHAVRRGAPAVASSVWISMPSPPLHPTIAAASVGRRPKGPPRQLEEIGSSRRRRGERRVRRRPPSWQRPAGRRPELPPWQREENGGSERQRARISGARYGGVLELGTRTGKTGRVARGRA